MPEFHNDTYTIDMIIAKILTDDRQYDISKLIAAYEYAAQCHEGQVRSSGEPYIIHPVAVAYILLIQSLCGLIQVGLRLEVANSESDTPMFETMTENRHKAIYITGIVEGSDELLDWVTVAHTIKPLPLLQLGSLNEVDKRVGIQTCLRVISVGSLRIASCR